MSKQGVGETGVRPEEFDAPGIKKAALFPERPCNWVNPGYFADALGGILPPMSGALACIQLTAVSKSSIMDLPS